MPYNLNGIQISLDEDKDWLLIDHKRDLDDVDSLFSYIESVEGDNGEEETGETSDDKVSMENIERDFLEYFEDNNEDFSLSKHQDSNAKFSVSSLSVTSSQNQTLSFLEMKLHPNFEQLESASTTAQSSSQGKVIKVSASEQVMIKRRNKSKGKDKQPANKSIFSNLRVLPTIPCKQSVSSSCDSIKMTAEEKCPHSSKKKPSSNNRNHQKGGANNNYRRTLPRFHNLQRARLLKNETNSSRVVGLVSLRDISNNCVATSAKLKKPNVNAYKNNFFPVKILRKRVFCKNLKQPIKCNY